MHEVITSTLLRKRLSYTTFSIIHEWPHQIFITTYNNNQRQKYEPQKYNRRVIYDRINSNIHWSHQIGRKQTTTSNYAKTNAMFTPVNDKREWQDQNNYIWNIVITRQQNESQKYKRRVIYNHITSNIHWFHQSDKTRSGEHTKLY